ncbi:regulator of protease activity HflC (stomatin/prohibitin superfamily) [Ereboglobus sp. PH5-5]|uniref:slipin family protein n=1 Tax=Ereboglobus sp. PH5-5 TaxID=2940529 RepID=UPI0024060CA1|nr:SPFH domain-containing protein [Ereboglobus sp. PH5-5]MDF9832791.1 regulator of protease activity HflC (stomatin/prohibitin superfamily) [Ereboglobus sp. PH5-5]
MKNEIIIKDTHRGLRYEDGVMKEILGPGRYELPGTPLFSFMRKSKVEIVLVDMRERDLTIKGQEILTADKVAIRVSIIVQFKVTDPVAALHHVSNHDERLYSDVQLAARRSLASMTLEEILTNRTRLSEDILRDVKGAAAGYGVGILRADVKDLVFPGNLQEIMNKVLAAERLSQAQLIETRTKAEQQKIEAEAKAKIKVIEAGTAAETDVKAAESHAAARLKEAQAEAEALRIRNEAEIRALREQAQAAEAYARHPALLRLRELEALAALSKNANARIVIGFDKYAELSSDMKRETHGA